MPVIASRKIIVQRLSSDFRAATSIETDEIDPADLCDSEIMIRVRFAGINASDSNFSAGKYTPGVEPPFDCGFEAVGDIVGCGPGLQSMLGQAAAFAGFGAFAEYLVVPAEAIMPVGRHARPTQLAMLVSGLTASLACAYCLEVDDHVRRIRSLGKTPAAIVTAAAGGTGQFAVQLLRLWGCKVAGTCSTGAKIDQLKELGCDLTINYRTESIHGAARTWSACGSRGVDFVYESVGGTMFDDCVDLLARCGRLAVIGFVSGYRDGSGWKRGKPVAPEGTVSASALISKAENDSSAFLLDTTPSRSNALHASASDGPDMSVNCGTGTGHAGGEHDSTLGVSTATLAEETMTSSSKSLDKSLPASGSGSSHRAPWPVQLLAKSASVRGFFLNHYSREQKKHLTVLSALVAGKHLLVRARVHPSRGLEGVSDAVEHMLGVSRIGDHGDRGAWASSGGKLCVEIMPPLSEADKESAARRVMLETTNGDASWLPMELLGGRFEDDTKVAEGRELTEGGVAQDADLPKVQDLLRRLAEDSSIGSSYAKL